MSQTAYAMSIPTIGDPETLAKTTQTQPDAKAGHLVIANKAASVNFIDTMIRAGKMPEGVMPSLPHIPGVEGSGTIVGIGEGVTGFSMGDRVAWMGPIGAEGYSSYSQIQAHGVTQLPDTLSFETGAAFPVNAMTAWHMLNNLSDLKPNAKILIHAAAGGVGSLAVQIAKSMGHHVIASVSGGKIAFAKEMGADACINYREEDISQRINELTDGQGVDLSLNPIAGPDLAADLARLAPHGTCILFGFLGGFPMQSLTEAMLPCFTKSVALRLSDIYSYYNADPAGFHKDLNHVEKLVENGTIRPVVDHTLPLEQAAQAHRLLEGGKVTGKVILSV